MLTREIGLEISSSSVRIAEIAVRGGKTKLTSYAQVRLPFGAVVDGAIVDRHAVRAAIERCARNAHVPRKRIGVEVRARVGIDGLRAVTRDITILPVPDDELDRAIQLQAIDIIPFEFDQTIVSAQPLKSELGFESSEQRVLLVAAHRELIDPVVEVVSETGIIPVSVDLSPLALVRSLGDRRDIGGPEALVSIGADLTAIVVHERTEVHFLRSIPAGGNAVTSMIANSLAMTFEEAEELKRHLGDDSLPTPNEALVIARDKTSQLLFEIRSSIEYYESLPGRSKVKQVVITGGGSRLVGLGERIQMQSLVPVYIGNPLERLSYEGKSPIDPATCAPAIGLAKSPPTSKRINLLPPELTKARGQRRLLRAVELACVLVIVVVLGVGALRFLQVRAEKSTLAQLTSQIATYEGEIPEFAEVQKQFGQLVADEQVALPIVSGEVNWPAVLAALKQYTPPGISTSSFVGTTTLPASAVDSPSPGATTPPKSSALLGSIRLSLTGNQYPAFKAWFDAMQASKRFEVIQFSGISSGGKGISFNAQLAITGMLHSSRLANFKVSGT